MAAFRHFDEQAIRLADVELRHAQLEAQNEHVEAMVAASEAQAEQLRNDLERHAEQTQLVNNRQQEIRKEVAQLEMQRVASQARLNKALRDIHQLRATSNERIPHLFTRRTELTGEKPQAVPATELRSRRRGNRFENAFGLFGPG